MTSTLLTVSNARATAGLAIADMTVQAGGWLIALPLSSDLRAIAGRNVFLFRVLPGRIFDHRPQQLVIAFDPVGDIIPFRAVPLVDARHARAFVVAARQL